VRRSIAIRSAPVLRTSLALGCSLVIACGDPTSGGPDGGGGVIVLAPNGGEALTAAEPFEIRWQGADGLPCDVELVGAAGATTIGSGVTASSLVWSPPGVAAAAEFRVRVVASAGPLEDTSDAAFTISPPAVGVSLARDVQPVFTTRCTTRFCHGMESQVALLNLAAGAAHGALVEVASASAACRAFLRVKPGQADQSYLIWKLTGAGTCVSGVRMPKDAPALPAAELNLIRTWITEGAKPN
jgi:hypothetical protein